MTDPIKQVTTGSHKFAEAVGIKLAEIELRASAGQSAQLELEKMQEQLKAVLTTAPAVPVSPPTPAVSAVPTATAVTAEPTGDELLNLAGMDPNTGKLVRGITYLKQRLNDAIHTPKRSQVLLRARGSDLPDLIDSPQNQNGTLLIMAAIASAISDPLSGVPDFVVTRIKILSVEMKGRGIVELAGKYLGNDIEVTV